MKRIEQAMLAAILKRKPMRKGNTEVVISDGGSKVSVFLHGNKIYMASTTEGWAWFSLCGWNTPTTRSRLNALGINVRQRNWQALYNGLPIDANAVIYIN